MCVQVLKEKTLGSTIHESRYVRLLEEIWHVYFVIIVINVMALTVRPVRNPLFLK
jgi:hypothetical protein